MTFKSFFKDMNIEKKDLSYLLILLIYCLILSYMLLKFNLKIGVTKPDVYLYLYNGLDLAGLGGTNVNNAPYMYLSPVISILVAIFFKMGLIHRGAIFIVTGFFSVLMIFGMYVFLKTRFSSLLSLFGAILLSSFSSVLSSYCNGTINLACVCMSIWILNFTIMAVDKNPKYYLLAIPLCVIGIFTKYPVAFMIPLMLLYYFSKHNIIDWVDCLLYDKKTFINKTKSYIKSKECKYILFSIIIALILSVAFCSFVLDHGTGLSFVTQASDSAGGFSDTKYTKDTNFDLDYGTYINGYSSYLFSNGYLGTNVSLILYLLIIIAVILNIVNFIKNRSELRREKEFNNKYFSKILYLIIILLAIISIFGFKISHFVPNIAMLIIFTILFSILGKYKIKREKYSISILAVSWFLIYFIFFSFINIKSMRYITTTYPAFVYFVVWSINSIIVFATNKKKSLTRDNKLKDNRTMKIAKLLIILICVVLMIHSVSFDSTDSMIDTDKDVEIVCDYLMDFDADYADKDIGSTQVYGRAARWYLEKDINWVQNEEKYQLDASNNTYLILKGNDHYDNYSEIFKSGKIRLFQRNVA